MSESLQYRVLGCVVALLFALGVPAFLLGPFLFGGVQFELVSGSALWSSVGIAIVGMWLALVCALADAEVVEKVVAPFAGAEVVVLFLPYMLFVGTAALWRRLLSRSKGAEVSHGPH
jgi:ABC-type Fe3+ transport system permease subunit